MMNMGRDLEGIMLSEIDPTEKDKHCMMSLICGIKKKKLVEMRSGTVVTRRWENWGDTGQRVQTSGSKMNKFWGPNV